MHHLGYHPSYRVLCPLSPHRRSPTKIGGARAQVLSAQCLALLLGCLPYRTQVQNAYRSRCTSDLDRIRVVGDGDDENYFVIPIWWLVSGFASARQELRGVFQAEFGIY